MTDHFPTTLFRTLALAFVIGAMVPIATASAQSGATEGQKLAWVRPNRLRDYEMPPADVPLISHLMALL